MHSTHQHSEGCFRHLFEELEDAVVKFELVDGEPIIVHPNSAFVDVFGYDSETVIGEPLNELIVPATRREEAAQFDQRTQDGESNAAIVKRMTDEGERKFVYRGIPYKDRYGFAIYSDITDELQRERHLEVLHRVLRHNLRNDLTVVLGMATDIIESTDEEHTRRAAQKIKQKASDLSQLSDEANTIEKVLGETVTVGPVELKPLVNDVIADCNARFESASITTEVPAGLCVSANDKLQIVVRSLLDNAIRHNDTSNPQATVTATELDSTVELEVVDNGPGIPKAEQRLITGDQEITPLNHGSGLGLWLVKWIVDAYGGHLDIETSKSDGSIVRIRLTQE
ncbi:PAS domain S-box-containing protein [Halohasta litchfieldiae]|jgi:PAS domain S-box-containing protein|uniref:histidine kinase n=1 Tax=Halohasta litchfieldiae TaxID=1073996 RepID=A0A1H6RHQ7_9EURY|nr:ATP-binding protein [Halohasta litchfieldiae]ATW89703.1 PAS domain S-box-containing protein [Halohasta litchfieldiae]SEI53986.1 PAS domain S-box-containing protein [Halohasta litchfieldiae]